MFCFVPFLLPLGRGGVLLLLLGGIKPLKVENLAGEQKATEFCFCCSVLHCSVLLRVFLPQAGGAAGGGLARHRGGALGGPANGLRSPKRSPFGRETFGGVPFLLANTAYIIYIIICVCIYIYT